MVLVITDVFNEVLKHLEVGVLAYVVIADILIGTTRALQQKTLQSCFGINGLLKHFLVMFVVVSFTAFSKPLDLGVMATGLTIFFIIQYLLSIIENLYVMGVPIPKSIYDKLLDYTNENPNAEIKKPNKRSYDNEN